jgi:hypothetical protein
VPLSTASITEKESVMPKFYVIVRRLVEMTTTITLTAEDEDTAHDTALEWAEGRKNQNHLWYEDDEKFSVDQITKA